jgi:hypothetical protein
VTLKKPVRGAVHLEPVPVVVPPDWVDIYVACKDLLQLKDEWADGTIHALGLLVEPSKKETGMLAALIKSRRRYRQRVKMTRAERYGVWLADQAKRTPEFVAAETRRFAKASKKNHKRAIARVELQTARRAVEAESRSAMRPPTMAEREKESGPRREHMGIVHRDVPRIPTMPADDDVIYPMGRGPGRPTLRVIGADSGVDDEE